MAGSSRTMLLSRVLVLCLMTSWSSAKEASNIRLPTHLRPYRYAVNIEPHLNSFIFSGNMTLIFECLSGTNQIFLHAKELHVSNISLAVKRWDPRRLVPRYVNHSMDTDRQFLIINLNRRLLRRSYYTLSMTFNASLNSQPMAGFYIVSYSGPSGQKYMASTHFEPTDARRVFPCMDEPIHKATFNITIIRRTSDTAISNMPIKTSVSLGGDRMADQFETTKKMSTYHLAFAVGDLDRRSATSRSGKTVEMWSRPEVVDQLEYVLNFTVQALDFFEDLFQVQYPLPKLSLLAVPKFVPEAMGNWGLIMLRENFFLLDPAVASDGDRFWIASVVAHEVAQMWFGGLVTLFWWDELWLSEGFAAFMAYLAMDHVYPEWNVMGVFVTSFLQNAMSIDGGFSSHPIHSTVNTPDEIHEHFDYITYFKAASVIRMLRNAVGESRFRTGVKNYLSQNHLKYRSVHRINLWRQLAQQSQLDGRTLNVRGIMNTWIMQMNYPIVTVTRRGKWLIFTQQRFLDDRNATDPGTHTSRYGYKWDIPVTYTTSENTDFSNNNIHWLNREKRSRFPMSVWVSSLQSDSWVICNLNVMGYYRVNYDTDNWARLTQQLKRDHTVIPAANRAQIINDAWALANGGYLELSVALELLEYLGNETDYVPWFAAFTQLLHIDKMLMRTVIYDAYLAYIRDNMRGIYNQWRITDSSEGLTFEQKKVKSMVAHMACSAEVDQCKQDALALFTEWKNNTEVNTIDPDLREPIYCTGIQFGSAEDFQSMFNRFFTETNPEERERMLNSLTCSRDEGILRMLLEIIFSVVYRTQERMQVISRVGHNPMGTSLVWNFVREEWDRIFDSYGEQPGTLSNVLQLFGTYFKDQIRLQEFQAFVNQTDDFGTASRTVVTVQETIRTNIDWLGQNYVPIQLWLQG